MVTSKSLDTLATESKMTRKVYRPQDDLVGQKVFPRAGRSVYTAVSGLVVRLGLRLVRQQKLELSQPALLAFARKSLAELTYPHLSVEDLDTSGAHSHPQHGLTSNQEETLVNACARHVWQDYSTVGFSHSQQRKSRLGNARRWKDKPSAQGLAGLETVAGLPIKEQARVLGVSTSTISTYRRKIKEALAAAADLAGQVTQALKAWVQNEKRKSQARIGAWELLPDTDLMSLEPRQVRESEEELAAFTAEGVRWDALILAGC